MNGAGGPNYHTSEPVSMLKDLRACENAHVFHLFLDLRLDLGGKFNEF